MEKLHKRLDVWKLAVELAVSAYRVTEKFLGEERFGLTGQMRRAAAAFRAILPKERPAKARKNLPSFFTQHAAR